ncbi:MAG: polysaccharide biosynthesis/export family protein [Pirellulales bacterium]|nr:polysaccharide biosynthesis/export family protein [Pirellulales bacterium]
MTDNREVCQAPPSAAMSKGRVLVLWVSVAATLCVAAFAWNAHGQGQVEAPNTRRFLEQYAAAQNSTGVAPPSMSFEAVGGESKTEYGQTDEWVKKNSENSTQQPAHRVAEHRQDQFVQGPSFGPIGASPQQGEYSVLVDGPQIPADQHSGASSVPTQPPPAGQLQFAPPEFPVVPSPVGGFGQAGSEFASQGRNALGLPPNQQPALPLSPAHQNAYAQPAQQQPKPGFVPSQQGTTPGVPSTRVWPNVAPTPRPQYALHPDQQGGFRPPFANAGHGLTTPYGQGAYVNPGRTEHVADYRLRVDDVLDCVYRMTRDESSKPYELNVGDKIRVESLSEPKITRELIIQPDGTVSLLLLGQVRATRQTVEQFRRRLVELYREFYRQPDITITPLLVNTKLLDVINTVDSRAGAGGQVRQAKVAPDGTISLPAVGKIPVQGMTLDEVKREIDARYANEVEGVEVTPILTERAKRFVYVVGEARQPGRYELLGPTNVMQAISLAGGWNVGANLRQVIILRRGPDWRVQATMLDVWDALYGNRTCPIDDIWLSDSDVVIIPKMKILVADDFIELIFTRGIYGVFPFQGVSMNFSKLSTL